MAVSVIKLLKTLVLFLGSLYVLALVLLYLFQTHLLFPAPGLPRAELPAGAETVEMTMPDGVTLQHIRLRNSPDAPKIMFFHGNGSLAFHELYRGLELHLNGFDVLLVEYRGYGGSSGSPSADSLMSDAVATYDQYTSDSSAKIFLYAHSLGTGIATHLASRRPVSALALEAPYSSTADLAADRYPMFPVRLLFKHDIPSERFVQSVDAPVMMVHGELDRVIPIAFGRRLFDAYRSDAKAWHSIPSAGHNDLLSSGTLDLVLGFFSSR